MAAANHGTLDPYPGCDIIAQNAGCPLKIRMLWIGNSYTSYNDLPLLVQQYARAHATAPLDITFNSALTGGASLTGHARKHEVADLLGEAGADHAWDVVVLQDQSRVPGGGCKVLVCARTCVVCVGVGVFSLDPGPGPYSPTQCDTHGLLASTHHVTSTWLPMRTLRTCFCCVLVAGPTLRDHPRDAAHVLRTQNICQRWTGKDKSAAISDVGAP